MTPGRPTTATIGTDRALRPARSIHHEVRVPSGESGPRRVGALEEPQDHVSWRRALTDVLIWQREFAQAGVPSRCSRFDWLPLQAVWFRVRVRVEGRVWEARMPGPESGTGLLGISCQPFDQPSIGRRHVRPTRIPRIGEVEGSPKEMNGR